MVRIGLGLGLVGLGLAIYTPYLFNTISSSAVINAVVVPVLSPIDGRIVDPPPTAGSFVAAGAVLARVENHVVDRGTLAQLRIDASTLQERAISVRQQMADLQGLRDNLIRAGTGFREASVERLELQLKEAIAQRDMAQATLRETEQDFARQSILRQKGTVSEAAVERSQGQLTRARAEADRSKWYVRRVEQELEAARHGIFVAQDRNDVPYSQQRIDEISIRMVELAAQLRELEGRRHEVERALTAEEHRNADRSAVNLISPIDAVVLRRPVERGSWVAVDGLALSLIDCQHLFVTVSLHGRHFERIRPGEVAQVRLTGSDETVSARVRELRGIGASDPNDRLAALPPPVGPNEFLVTLDLDPAIAKSHSAYCHVGRGAEVRFPAEIPGARLLQESWLAFERSIVGTPSPVATARASSRDAEP